ncbi:hypothetical protein [Bowmanella denitrificans]|uniref:hypothetical protein n=1 Tax=Bowmanella denitrificans TaxID=366582 RepID=UPI000C99B166|nr:hypothetical protein [Bowmanella denitrificans]
MRRVQLTEPVKKALKPALWGNAKKAVFAEIESGKAGVFVTHNNQLLTVLRLEGREMVVVAAVGQNLRANRQELINFALANHAMTLRWHTKAPQHLQKGVAGLPVQLAEVRKRALGPDEYVYKLQVA